MEDKCELSGVLCYEPECFCRHQYTGEWGLECGQFGDVGGGGRDGNVFQQGGSDCLVDDELSSESARIGGLVLREVNG